MATEEEVKTKLKAARIAAGLTQKQLAAKAEIKLNTLKALECGNRKINKTAAILVHRLAYNVGKQVWEILEAED